MVFRSKLLIFIPIGTLGVSYITQAAEWSTVRGSSSVTFVATQEGSQFQGLFETFSAEVDFDTADPNSGQIIGIVEPASVNSGDAERDATLLDRDWFDPNNYPESKFESEQIEEMNSHSGDRIISNQPHYSLLFRNSEIDPIPQSHKLGIGSIVYSPIGRGLLTGKYKPGHNFKRNDARFGHTAFSKENFERGYKIYEVLYEWSKDKNYNVSQLVIAWTLHTTGVVSAICGAKNPEQAISNAQAGDINLTQDDLDEINKITKELSIFDKT